jgi:hypothetical protein
MTFQVFDNNGRAVDAHFDIEGLDVVFRSRGGKKGLEGSQNSQYSLGLKLLLERIAASDLRLETVWVDSRDVQALSLADRLVITADEFASNPGGALTLINTRMKHVRPPSKPTVEGGNSTKRLRLRFAAGTETTAIAEVLGARSTGAEMRSLHRLPAETLERVSPVHLWNAVQRLCGDNPPTSPFNVCWLG